MGVFGVWVWEVGYFGYWGYVGGVGGVGEFVGGVLVMWEGVGRMLGLEVRG